MKNKFIDRILNCEPTLIAEIGVNYYDIASKLGITPLSAAELMITKAASAGAHAVKFQSYKASTLAAAHSPAYWDLTENPVTSQRELFAQYDAFDAEEFTILSHVAADAGVEFMSTPFDYHTADYVDDLVSVHKISSSDLTNTPFIRYIASKGKPCMLSTGAGNLAEIRRAVDVIRSVNHEPIVLMHCVLEYPTPLNHVNLGKIAALRKEFPSCCVGYSDHTKPMLNDDVIKLAVALGATVVEKHFTLDKTLPGNDHFHSMDPLDLRRIVSDMKITKSMFGHDALTWESSEDPARKYARRSAVAARSLKAGEILTSDDVVYKRPGGGVSPDNQMIFGRTLVRNVPEDTVISLEDLQD